MDKSLKRQWLSLIPYLLIPAFVGLVAYGDDIYYHFTHHHLSFPTPTSHSNNSATYNSDNSTVTVNSTGVNINDVSAVNNYLTSKTFKYSNLSIKFYPEGYFQLSHDYEVSLTGKWTVTDGGNLFLTTEVGNSRMTLSSDGTIIDNKTSQVFQ